MNTLNFSPVQVIKRSKADVIYLLIKSESETEQSLQRLTGWSANEIKEILCDLVKNNKIIRSRQRKCTFVYTAASHK